MMDRSRSPLRILAVTASLASALSLAELGSSHAGASNSPPSASVDELPCNDVCRDYMSWSDRVAPLFRPSPSAATTAAQRTKPPRAMADHAAKPRRPALNSFAQWPTQGVATPDLDEPPPVTSTSPARIGASRPRDQIADRLPALPEFIMPESMMTPRARRGSAAADAAGGSTMVARAGTPATPETGTDGASVGALGISLIALLCLALGGLPALQWRRRARRSVDRERLLTFDKAVAGAQRKSMPMQLTADC